MDPRAVFLGLILAAIAILFGYQACFFFRLRMEGEIGGIRFGFLITTLVFSLTFVMTHLSSPLSLPIAVSALVFWSIFHLRDKITGEKIDRKFDEIVDFSGISKFLLLLATPCALKDHSSILKRKVLTL
jgi:hypothetical protein